MTNSCSLFCVSLGLSFVTLACGDDAAPLVPPSSTSSDATESSSSTGSGSPTSNVDPTNLVEGGPTDIEAGPVEAGPEEGGVTTPPDGAAPDCCPISDEPDCCMFYGGSRNGNDDNCGRTCDGMPWPSADWRRGVDAQGCPIWIEPPRTDSCCGCFEEPDASATSMSVDPDSGAPSSSSLTRDAAAGNE